MQEKLIKTPSSKNTEIAKQAEDVFIKQLAEILLRQLESE